jgi:hypothetical protein
LWWTWGAGLGGYDRADGEEEEHRGVPGPLVPLHPVAYEGTVVCARHRVIAAVCAIWLSIYRAVSSIITTVCCC